MERSELRKRALAFLEKEKASDKIDDFSWRYIKGYVNIDFIKGDDWGSFEGLIINIEWSHFIEGYKEWQKKINAVS